jgi:hypothetical protein
MAMAMGRPVKAWGDRAAEAIFLHLIETNLINFCQVVGMEEAHDQQLCQPLPGQPA